MTSLGEGSEFTSLGPEVLRGDTYFFMSCQGGLRLFITSSVGGQGFLLRKVFIKTLYCIKLSFFFILVFFTFYSIWKIMEGGHVNFWSLVVGGVKI